MENLYLAGFVQALFFCSLVLMKKEKQLKDYLLTVFLFILGTNLLLIYSFATGLIGRYSIFIYMDIYYWVLLGPSLLVYTSVLISGKNKIAPVYILTLIPAIAVTICFSEFIFGNINEFFNNLGRQDALMKTGSFIWFYNSVVFYIISLVLIYRHRKGIKKFYSYSKNVDLKWLYILNHGFGLFLFFLLIQPLLTQLLGYRLPSISWIVMVLYIFGIGHFGYRQKDLFQGSENKEEDSTQSQAPEIKNITAVAEERKSYQKSGLTENESSEILKRIDEAIETEKAYLDPELDLPKLAEITGVSTHKVSQVINDNLNKNFFELVNEHRIRDVKAKLLDPKYNHYTILSIAFDSGFNSKSTFYTLFKKNEHQTPAQFRDKQLQKVV